jgi:aerobic-type carbon monoxide dehydrogenase small subunit (CoxS/CutS family)
MEEKVQFELNGKQVEAILGRNETLLWALRTQFNLTGTKYGCGEGFCGSCTVLVNDEPVRSCVTPLEDVAGAKVITIEGLAEGEKLHPVQQAFVDNDAMQCGYCTPGMILNATALLKKNPEPTRKEIIDGMDGNLCRCGAHTRIIKAIESASKMMKGGQQR